jgi:hypothetical protein
MIVILDLHEAIIVAYPISHLTACVCDKQVMDLAEGHVAALRYIRPAAGPGLGQHSVFNLGTGKGFSVLEMVAAMEKASRRPVPYEIGPRYCTYALCLHLNPIVCLFVCLFVGLNFD